MQLAVFQACKVDLRQSQEQVTEQMLCVVHTHSPNLASLERSLPAAGKRTRPSPLNFPYLRSESADSSGAALAMMQVCEILN